MPGVQRHGALAVSAGGCECSGCTFCAGECGEQAIRGRTASQGALCGRCIDSRLDMATAAVEALSGERDALIAEKLGARAAVANPLPGGDDDERDDPPVVLGAVWFTDPRGGLIGLIAVQGDLGEEWAAYIGIAAGWSDEIDSEWIAKYGSKVPAAVARAAFEKSPFVGWGYRE